MKKIKQFRYYGEKNSQNYPSNINKNSLVNDNIFNSYGLVKQLGIQTLPGIKFRLNSSSNLDWIVIGSTGIYELDLEDLLEIEKIQFHNDSIELINSNLSASLIIDIIYEDMEGIE